MDWDDGREKLDEIIEYNKKCKDEDVIYDCGEWFSSDGVIWSAVNNNGNLITYNPDGEDIVGESIWDNMDMEKVDHWYTENFESLIKQYGGNAIAVINNKVVAVEKSKQKVNDIIRQKFPNEIPFIAYIPSEVEIQCQM